MSEYVFYITYIFIFVKTIKFILNNKQVFDHRVLRNKIHEDNQVYTKYKK